MRERAGAAQTGDEHLPSVLWAEGGGGREKTLPRFKKLSSNFQKNQAPSAVSLHRFPNFCHADLRQNSPNNPRREVLSARCQCSARRQATLESQPGGENLPSAVHVRKSWVPAYLQCLPYHASLPRGNKRVGAQPHPHAQPGQMCTGQSFSWYLRQPAIALMVLQSFPAAVTSPQHFSMLRRSFAFIFILINLLSFCETWSHSAGQALCSPLRWLPPVSTSMTPTPVWKFRGWHWGFATVQVLVWDRVIASLWAVCVRILFRVNHQILIHYYHYYISSCTFLPQNKFY